MISQALRWYYGSAFHYVALFATVYNRERFWSSGYEKLDGLIDATLMVLSIWPCIVFIETRCEVCKTLLYRYNSELPGWPDLRAIIQPLKCPVCHVPRALFETLGNEHVQPAKNCKATPQAPAHQIIPPWLDKFIRWLSYFYLLNSTVFLSAAIISATYVVIYGYEAPQLRVLVALYALGAAFTLLSFSALLWKINRLADAPKRKTAALYMAFLLAAITILILGLVPLDNEAAIARTRMTNSESAIFVSMWAVLSAAMFLFSLFKILKLYRRE